LTEEARGEIFGKESSFVGAAGRGIDIGSVSAVPSSISTSRCSSQYPYPALDAGAGASLDSIIS
jgi:hypothetical protein